MRMWSMLWMFHFSLAGKVALFYIMQNLKEMYSILTCKNYVVSSIYQRFALAVSHYMIEYKKIVTQKQKKSTTYSCWICVIINKKHNDIKKKVILNTGNGLKVLTHTEIHLNDLYSLLNVMHHGLNRVTELMFECDGKRKNIKQKLFWLFSHVPWNVQKCIQGILLSRNNNETVFLSNWVKSEKD